jgi:hypothetical protein
MLEAKDRFIEALNDNSAEKVKKVLSDLSQSDTIPFICKKYKMDWLEVALKRGAEEVAEIIYNDLYGKEELNPSPIVVFRTPLEEAIESGYEKIALLLIEKGVNVDGVRRELFKIQGMGNPLRLAIQNSMFSTAQTLIQKGAYFNDERLISYTKTYAPNIYQGLLKMDEGIKLILKEGKKENDKHAEIIKRSNDNKEEGVISEKDKAKRFSEKSLSSKGNVIIL